MRLNEITEWAGSEENQKLLNGQYETPAPESQTPAGEPSAPQSSVTTYVTQLGRSAGSALTGLFARATAADPHAEGKNAADEGPSDGS
jgi:hypothetical protein